MSGLEVTLAVVPIFITGLQSFSALRRTFNLIRHSGKEVEWLREKVDIQARCFRSHVHLLLIDVLPPKEAQSLIWDPEHSGWKSGGLEENLRLHMGEGYYREFGDALERVQEIINDIDAKLAIFAQPQARTRFDRAVKDKLRVVIRKQEYEEDIGDLKVCIAELKSIRKLVRRIRASAVSTAGESGTQVASRAEPPAARLARDTARQYEALRRFSLDSQSFLQQQWSCNKPSHTYHGGRLLLQFTGQQAYVAWLLEYAGQHGSTSHSTRLLFHVSSLQLGPITPNSDQSSSREYFDGPTPKRQKISLQGQVPGDLIDQDSKASGSEDPYQASGDAALGDVDSLCRQLEACSVNSAPGGNPRPFECVDDQRQKLLIFATKSAEMRNAWSWNTHRTTALTELFNHRVHHVMLHWERVQLAVTLAKATLVNYSTPAWQGCILDNVCFCVGLGGNFTVGTILDTLHIATPLGNLSNDFLTDTDMESPDAKSIDAIRYDFGVRNQDLFRLGVALLSIALWRKVSWEDIPAARRKADALDTMGFGAPFHRAVDRLINFSFDVNATELSDERLQIEIQQKVIAPLESWAAFCKKSEPE